MTAVASRRVDATGRATGRLRTNRHTKIQGQFGARLIEMLESPAHRILSLSGRRVLDRLEIEQAHHGGKDNGKLPVTFSQFEEYGIDRHAIAPAIRECAALGFLEVTERGQSGNGEFRKPNLFRLTFRPCGSEPPSDEWRKIETIEDADILARAARQAGKIRKPVGENAIHSGENPHRRAPSPVGKTPTTAQVGKPPLPLYLGEGTDAAA
jgi:hypothetical protein